MKGTGIKTKVLVVGCGSIGERHLRCFQKTGRAEPVACDLRPEVLRRMQEQYGVPGYTDFNEALGAQAWDMAIICTPANRHIDVSIRCLEHRLHVLIEKPLSISLEGIGLLQNAVAASGKFTAVGYVWHFWPGLKALREFLRSGAFGRPLQVAVTTGQHFPTFRPAYREIYYTRHETGGGAIQDSITHNVNAVEWLVGPTTRVYCEAAHQFLEGVTVEDTVCITARNGGVLVSYAQNQFQPPNETTYLVHCEDGSLKLEVHKQRWGAWPRGADGWQYHATPVAERDDLFVAQANAFLDGMAGVATDLCSIAEAIQTLKFNLAALESCRSGTPIAINP
jgi:predicted dehydrogenase